MKINKSLYVSEDPGFKSNRPQFIQKPVKAIIMGNCGAGKTMMLNTICATKYQVGETATSSSLTRGFVAQKCKLLSEGTFLLFDSPGTTATEDVKKHAMMIRQCLTITPLNAIFIVVPFSCRGSETIDKIYDVFAMVEKYKKKVIFMISKIDNITQKEKMIEGFIQSLKKNDIYQPSIFFSNTESDPEILSNIMYSFASKIQETQMIFQEKQFYSSFNLSNLTSIFKKKNQVHFKQADEIIKQYCDFARQIPNIDQKDEILDSMIEFVRQELQGKMNIIYQKYQNLAKDQQDQAYSIFLGLQGILFKKMQQFINVLNSLKNYKISFVGADKQDIGDPRYLIRQCKFCKIPWMKVQGCRNVTTCGNKPINFDFWQTKTIYKFVRENKKIKLQKMNINNKLKDVKKETNNKQQKRVGCGAEIDWKTLDPHPKSEEMIRQIYQNDEQMIKNLNKYIEADKQKVKQSFQQINEKMKSEVDQNSKQIKQKINSSWW